MKYMGSKARIAKRILPHIHEALSGKDSYVEPFCGGMNMMSEVVAKNRAGNDYNRYVAAMWQKLIEGWVPPESVTKEFYASCRDTHPDHVIGYVGINCSYSGKWFGGYAGITKTKIGTERNYQKEAWNNVMSQVDKLQGVKVFSGSYSDVSIPDSSVIYCDPPYANTTGYKDSFDSGVFWVWVRGMCAKNHTVLVSEYVAPDDFICIAEFPVKSSLSANGKTGGSKLSVEKLFMHESQVPNLI